MKKNAEEQDERKNSETDYFLKSRKHEKNVYINTSSHRSAMLYTYSWKAIYKLGTD